jgi:hypothetical protein
MAWILIASGVPTAAGSLAAFLFPEPVLRFVFGAGSASGVTTFLIRHWGVLLFVVCALTVYSACVPATRPPILIAAIIEKSVIVALIVFGPVKRTVATTAIAILDGF